MLAILNQSLPKSDAGLHSSATATKVSTKTERNAALILVFLMDMSNKGTPAIERPTV
jgi:hypothetical protein